MSLRYVPKLSGTYQIVDRTDFCVETNLVKFKIVYVINIYQYKCMCITSQL